MAELPEKYINGRSFSTFTERQMRNSRAFLLFLIFLLCQLSALAQQSHDFGPKHDIEFTEAPAERLFSPSVGRRFHEIAYELTNAENTTATDIEQALIFLNATVKLDTRAKYVLPDMIKVASQYSDQDRSELVNNLLAKYTDKSTDLEVAEKAVRYLLEQQNAREDREQLLIELLKNIGGVNAGFDSEIATLLGLLIAEKADSQNASSYLMQAYNDNKYNTLAFRKLAELAPDQISPHLYLEHLRRALGENPMNIEAALAFAQYAEQIQIYETAAGAYGYCVSLFRFLYPSLPLPDSLYLPWTITSYNTRRNLSRCLQIASELRQNDRFDLAAEAIAAKAAAKIGDNIRANKILKVAEEKALQLVSDNSSFKKINPEQLAWFYCFAMSNSDKALNWANKAYSIEPNSVTTAALLGYALVINGQTDWAKPVIEKYTHNQIAALAMAMIQLKEEKKTDAIETLKAAIAIDPASLAAEQAKQIIDQQGSQYLPPVDPDIVAASLRSSFGRAVVPPFVSPEKIISVLFSVRGSKFFYGSQFGGSVAIINKSSEPLIVSDNSLFMGNIRIDAEITGDINKKIPNLVTIRIRPALPIEQGKSILIPVRLTTNELKRILFTHPQASLNIEFTVFIDPVTTDLGTTTNRIQTIKPIKVAIERPGVKLTRSYLQNRLTSLAKGRQGQKIKTAQLFVGLLMEQQAMANREPLYKFMYADWMPVMLKSALLQHLNDEDWVAKIHTMIAMLSMPLDYELINAVAKNLDDNNWPVRMMANYLLAKKQGEKFTKVLDYSARYDSNELVRDMAVALGAPPPQTKQTPGNLEKLYLSSNNW